MLNSIRRLRYKNAEERKAADYVKGLLGFYPKNIALYLQAFRHSSASTYIAKGIKNSNERLEFLGDAVLSLVVAEYIFKLFPFKDEGTLTQLRARLVSRNTMNKLAQKIGINVMVDHKKGSASATSMGDALEAFIGAIYLDQGFLKTKKFVLEGLIKMHLDVNDVMHNDTDFKSQFLNKAQKEKAKAELILSAESGKGRHKTFHIDAKWNGKVLASSQSTSKKLAEQDAARKALENFQQE